MISIIVWCRYFSCVYSGRVPPFFHFTLPPFCLFAQTQRQRRTSTPREPPQLICLARHTRCLNSVAPSRIELSAVTHFEDASRLCQPSENGLLHVVALSLTLISLWHRLDVFSSLGVRYLVGLTIDSVVLHAEAPRRPGSHCHHYVWYWELNGLSLSDTE